MNELLQELVDSRGVPMRVDRRQGVIRGVKILGLESRNGRVYRAEALAEAVPLYEGAKVNVNHPRGNPQAPRDYQDRIGVIRNVAARAEGLFGDLHFNPKHTLAEQLLWDAEHAPENVGLSHNVEARTTRTADRVVVEAILRVQSVDLVADPATTRGLFESVQTAGPSSETPVKLGDLTIELLTKHRPDLVQALREEQAASASQLQAELDWLRAAEALREKQSRVRALLREHELPDPESAEGWMRSLVSPQFLQMVMAAPDEKAMRELMEDRSRMARHARNCSSAGVLESGRPCSRDQCSLVADVPRDARGFVEAIT